MSIVVALKIFETDVRNMANAINGVVAWKVLCVTLFAEVRAITFWTQNFYDLTFILSYVSKNDLQHTNQTFFMILLIQKGINATLEKN